ncbi:MAG: oxidoreductase [Myxococcales bacterium]|nr:oxidoreductase [Myxococcales bacterium]
MPSAGTNAPRAALLFGASGLVGGYCLERLLLDDAFGRVVVVVRRSLGRSHRKLEERVVDFAHIADAELPPCDDAFICLGTTIAKAGSETAFRKVDHDAVVAATVLARKSGVRRLALVSSVGASVDSGSFYLRVKGETERDAAAAGPFETLAIVRPSLLLGGRPERRLGEGLGQVVGGPLAPLFVGPVARYRPVHARVVAFAMIAAVLQGAEGTHIHEYSDIAALGQTLLPLGATIERAPSVRVGLALLSATLVVVAIAWLIAR